MKLKILGSGSSGNCYILENENEALVIECGVKFSEVKKALNFRLNKIVAALVSHSHNDHAGYIRDFVKTGITVLAHAEVFNAKGIEAASFKKELETEKVYTAGGFKIVPFELFHDVRCFGYIINHSETGNVLFATDTNEIPYDFVGINNFLIEANYSEEITYQNILENKLNAAHQERVEQSHMSVENTLKFLSETDLSQTNNIVLIHLSDDSSNALEFKERVELATAKSVFVAKKNKELKFNKTPF